MKLHTLLALSSIIILSCKKESTIVNTDVVLEGCTNAEAKNYEPKSTIDNGSCVYNTKLLLYSTVKLKGIAKAADYNNKKEVKYEVIQNGDTISGEFEALPEDWKEPVCSEIEPNFNALLKLSPGPCEINYRIFLDLMTSASRGEGKKCGALGCYSQIAQGHIIVFPDSTSPECIVISVN